MQGQVNVLHAKQTERDIIVNRLGRNYTEKRSKAFASAAYGVSSELVLEDLRFQVFYEVVGLVSL